MEILIKVLMFVTALFLVILILLQRGRGGGLAGALGGMGGQSAFGTKAGDVFTKITSICAIAWILLCVVAVKYMSTNEGLFDRSSGANAAKAEESVEAQPGGTPKQGKSPAGRAPGKEGKASPAPETASGESAAEESKPAETSKPEESDK